MLDTISGRGALVLAAALLFGACSLDLTDPNSPNEQDIVTDANGLIEVARGLQAEWGNELVDPVYIDALVTDDIGAIPQAFESYRLVDAGDPVSNDLGPSTETWSGMYDVIQIADIVLKNAPDVPMEPGTRSGLLVLGNLFKAMSFGSLLQVYERIPLTVGLDDLDAAFATREEGLATVLQLLDEARSQLQATPLSDQFRDDVLEPGLDLGNTIDALIARYSLISGDLAGAAAAAARVDPAVLSEARFSANDGNPLWNMWYNSGNAYRMRPEDRFRLEAEPGDGRVAYWVAEAEQDGSTEPLDDFVKYSVREHAWPFYLPDEMLLIRAEVAARQGDLTGALELVNEVRTPCASAVDEPVACLPALTSDDVPTQDAMLAQILHEREYELFLQGVHWSDLRRMGVTPKYPFMMVAETECERNPSAPAELCGITQ